MSRAREKGDGRQSFTQWIVVSIVLFVYFLLVLISYSSEMKIASESAARDEFSYHTQVIAAEFASDIFAVDQTARTTAAALSTEPAILSERSYDVLQRAVDSSSAIFGYVGDSAGNAVDIKGNSYNVMSDPDFAQALTGIQTISDVGEHEGGSDTFSFYAPISVKGTIEGVVCLQYPAEQFTTKPVLSDYDGYTTYALVRSDGTVINATGGSGIVDSGINIFDIMTEESSRSAELKVLKQNFENSRNAQAMVSIEGARWFICCAMIGVSDLYAVEFHTDKYYDRAAARLYMPTKNVLIRLFVALFLFFVAVIVLNVLNKTLYNRNAMELQNRADQDLLTGLLNKMATERYIQEHLEGEGKDEPSMLCVLDIDNFKKINDTMGHAFGDQVLATLGVKIKSKFRSSDIIGRIGGDEFIVFLKKIPNDEIMNKEADKLVDFFQSFKAGDYVKYPATASIGVAMYPEDGTTFEQLYKAADKGVYHSKQNGRNMLTLYRDIK